MSRSDDAGWERYLDAVAAGEIRDGRVRTLRRPAHDWQQWWSAVASSADPVVRTAASSGFVLTGSERLALGVTRARTRHAEKLGRWTAAGFGYSSPVDVREPADLEGPARHDADHVERRRRHTVQSCAGARRRPGATVTGRSCAILRGLPTMSVPHTPELTDRDVGQGRRSPAHLYSAALPDAEQELWFGIRVETVERMLVTLARHGRRDAMIAADAALREDLIDRAGIARALDTARGWPWVRQARAVLELADPRAESPLESITRLAAHDAGFPEPDLQTPFGPYDVDLYWPKYGLVLECDGAGKYVGRAWTRERERERLLKKYDGIDHIERVVWSDIVDTWASTERRLAPYFR